MPFEDLGEDILLRVLCLCDVHTVLRASAINTRLQRITLSKQLWLSLVQDSTFRAALELPPSDRVELEKHSTEELIHLVQSAVAGPDSLSNSRSTSTVTETMFRTTLLNMGDIKFPFVSLSPSSRYILLHSITRQESYIYDVGSARCVWRRPMPAYTRSNIDDISVAGDIARVFSAQPLDNHRGYALRVEEVDLTSGLTRELFDVGSITPTPITCAIAGDFVLYTMAHHLLSGQEIVLVNWRASTYVALGRNDYYKVKLIPGYLVSTYPEISSPHQLILAVTALGEFSPDYHLRPLTELAVGHQLRRCELNTRVTVQTRLEYKNQPLSGWFRDVQLTVTPSALIRGAYNVDVRATYPEQPTLLGKTGKLVAKRAQPMLRQVLLSYRFTAASSGHECTLRLPSAQRVSKMTPTALPRTVVECSDGAVIVSYHRRIILRP
ncbi:hypothetical protein C8R45DRAFT_1014165 [Mycena sanguinolenta]|nr:hypothetical protein C8R45DRAFT_1014165 [Mycena sanguinolenta]